MQIDLSELQDLAREGGKLARSYFRHATASRKADSSWVTEADIAVEQLLIGHLRVRYPTCGFIGEEQSRSDLEREYVWAIDPIDGTGAFVNGLPVWGVSIGLLHHGQPYLGAFYVPIADELYWNDPAGGAFLNGELIQVIGPRAWDTEDWIAIPSNSHRRYTISFPGKARSFGSSVADLCFVARGSALGALLTRCAIWDLAAGLAILGAAGGAYTGLSGAPPDLPGMTRSGDVLREPLVVSSPAHLEPLRASIGTRT
jgi:myo-inositol-1(or 4)-monophosphatase